MVSDVPGKWTVGVRSMYRSRMLAPVTWSCADAG
jgi:hypothetical protein